MEVACGEGELRQCSNVVMQSLFAAGRCVQLAIAGNVHARNCSGKAQPAV